MSKGGNDSTVTNKADPWSGVQPYLRNLYGMAGGQMGQPMQYFPYQTYPTQSPLTQAAQQANLNYAGSVLPALTNTGLAGIGSMMGAADVANSPYVNSMLASQAGMIGDQLTRQWLPAIESGAALMGQPGSTRQGVAEGVAIGDAAKALTNAAAQTQLGAYGQGLDQLARGMAFLPQMAQLGMMPAQVLGQVGGQQEAYQQQAINDAMQRFGYYQTEPWNRMNYASSIYAGVPWNTTQTTSGQGGSTAANVLGGGLTGASIGSALGTAIPSAFGLGGGLMGGSELTMLGMGLGPWGALIGAGLGLLGSR